MYGIKVNRNGMACCLFHNDKHPSMKMDKGFYCFACGAKGDGIHFVEKYFGISAHEAAMKLVNDFGISIESETKKSKSRFQKIQKKNPYQLMKEFEKWEKYCIRVLLDYLHLLEKWKLQYAPQYFDDEWKDEFKDACKCKEIVEYYLDILLWGALEERIEFVMNKGKEVKKIEERLEEYRRRNDDEDGISGQSNGKRLAG